MFLYINKCNNIVNNKFSLSLSLSHSLSLLYIIINKKNIYNFISTCTNLIIYLFISKIHICIQNIVSNIKKSKTSAIKAEIKA